MADRSEKAVQNDILIAVSALPDTMVWRNNTALAWVGERLAVGVNQMLRIQRGMVVLQNGRPLRAGIPGSPDILGVSSGMAIALEVKAAGGRQSDEQAKFQRAWERCGGVYGLPRSIDDALAIIRRGA